LGDGHPEQPGSHPRDAVEAFFAGGVEDVKCSESSQPLLFCEGVQGKSGGVDHQIKPHARSRSRAATRWGGVSGAEKAFPGRKTPCVFAKKRKAHPEMRLSSNQSTGSTDEPDGNGKSRS
jgi:hypothetical protein